MITFNDEYLDRRRIILVDEDNVAFAMTDEMFDAEGTMIHMKNCSGDGSVFINLPAEEVCRAISDQCSRNFAMRCGILVTESACLDEQYRFDHECEEDYETRI